MNKLIKKYGLAIKVLIIVIIVLGIKLFLHAYKIEFIEMNSLFTTMIGGAMFLIGFILAGTMADYKESEKIPSEVAASLESMYQEGEYVKSIKPSYDFEAHKKRLQNIVTSFENDLKKQDKNKQSIKALEQLSISMTDMEKVGASGSVARIKSEQTNLNKQFLRAFQIKETSFIPGAYAIAEIITLFVIGFMLLMKVENLAMSITIFGVIMYLFIYMVLFIKDIDDPFEEGGYADVDMFLLKGFKEKLQLRIQE